jgi:hypothetical protein
MNEQLPDADSLAREISSPLAEAAFTDLDEAAARRGVKPLGSRSTRPGGPRPRGGTPHHDVLPELLAKLRL